MIETQLGLKGVVVKAFAWDEGSIFIKKEDLPVLITELNEYNDFFESRD